MAATPGAVSELRPDPEALRHLHETERKNYWDAANLMAKAMTFYLAIAAAVLTYTLTKELPKDLSGHFVKGIAAGGLVITLAWAVGLIWGTRGLLSQAVVVSKLAKMLATTLPSDIISENLFRDFRRIIIVLAAGALLVLIVLFCSFLALLYR